MENQNNSRLPLIALCLDLAAAGSVALGFLCMYTVVLLWVGLLLFLAAVILPFIAIIVGIGALCLGKAQIGTRGIIMSVTAIALPVAVVLTVVLLFATGVAVIHWM